MCVIASFGHITIVRLLIEAKAQINKQTDHEKVLLPLEPNSYINTQCYITTVLVHELIFHRWLLCSFSSNSGRHG